MKIVAQGTAFAVARECLMNVSPEAVVILTAPEERG
jgi:hypothetical protein